MLSKNCPDKFSFSACKFNVQKSKEGTGRVVMWKMGIRNSFTMEATFCGSTLGKKQGTHFNTKDLESMGYHFCDSLLDYCDPDRTKYYQCLKELEEMQKHINLEKVLNDSDTSLKEITLDSESSSQGSDSSESNDSQTYFLKLTSQKKHLKTKKERNSTRASLRNARQQEQEVCDQGHLVQRHKQSNSKVKDTRPNVSDDYVFDYVGRQFPNQNLEKIPGRDPPWILKRCLSSRSVIQKLSKDQPRHFLKTNKRPIQGIIQPTSTDFRGNCFKVTPLKCAMSKRTPNWTEKTRIPTEDLHHNLKSKMKECTSFQRKKTGVNWTDDEKRIYRDKRMAQTEEILQYVLPIMESTKNMPTNQIKQIFNPRTNFQIQHQLHPATYGNIKTYRTSWAPPTHPPLTSQRNLMVSSSEWCKSTSQRSFESLSLPKGHKKRKNCSQIKALKTKDMKADGSKWETASSCFEKDVNIIKGKILQAKESNQQSSTQTVFPSN
nr:PREDICTED: cytosolic carboxypeptidase 3-like isoform X1 [Rhinolophus sinicus]